MSSRRWSCAVAAIVLAHVKSAVPLTDDERAKASRKPEPAFGADVGDGVSRSTRRYWAAWWCALATR